MIEYKSYKLRLSGINVRGRDLSSCCTSLSNLSLSLFLCLSLAVAPVIDALFPHPPSNAEVKIHSRRSQFIPEGTSPRIDPTVSFPSPARDHDQDR